MTNNIVYDNLALEWSPSGKRDSRFLLIAIICLIIVLAIAVTLSSIELPIDERQAVTKIPERIAQLVLEQEKKKPEVIPEPKPKPKPPEIKPKPRVKKQQEKEEQKPLTKKQKQAREKAKDTGLLALGSELADLIDTSEINAMVGKKVAKVSGVNKKASLNKNLLTDNIGKGSGGINSDKYASTTVSGTKLSTQELSTIRQSLLSKDIKEDPSTKGNQRGTGNLRAEEEITLVFDQNKSKLYSIYNRERRKNPGLKGKIVLEITIAPSGKVVSVKIVSSELNNPKLEKSLISRVKLFKFSAGKTEPVTITYPIAFLPS